ncbi:MAG: putative transcriptional regulator, TetR family [Actinomycetia bacterium]|nr:putative transcriptional regulator, TetR family [Actinomycetes bacterium]
MARTQAERRADTRDRLLQAAAARFAADGIDGASIDAIADDADRTSGSVYAHFGSKEGLLLALLDSWKNDVAVAATAEMATAPTMPGRLAALWRNFADPPNDGAHWVQLEHELWLYATRHADARDQLADRYRDIRRTVRDEMGQWRASGDITPPVADDVLGALLVALLIGLEMQHRLDPDAIDERVALAGLAALLGVTEPTEVMT